MTTPLKEIDDYRAMDGALLRAAFEVAARLTTEDYEKVPILALTCGRLREDDLVPVLDQVRRRRRAAPRDAGGDDGVRLNPPRGCAGVHVIRGR